MSTNTNANISIGTIPAANFHDYRIDVMFDGYKWDLQAGEQSTITDKAILLDRQTADYLANTAVSLYHETVAMEHALKARIDLVKQTGISANMANALCACNYNPDKHIRLMRFDFHPTAKGWRISEVNSDVPAGYPEASILPNLAEKYFDGYSQYGNFGDVWAGRLAKLAPQGSTIAYLHDTHTVEDYQILHFLGDLMEQRGYSSIYTDPAQIKWSNNQATGIGAIMRYYPVEWLEFHKDTCWLNFVNAATPSCNHPIALLAQSKRLPVIWDELGVNIPLWKALLPKTACATKLRRKRGWILKPAFGRVGEGINIPGTISAEEGIEIVQAAKSQPTQWVAQKMFKSLPVSGLHIVLGVFVVNGQFAGLFGRTSARPRIDADASEVPVLVNFER